MELAKNDVATKYQWKFFCAGGFDQVLLETGEDLLALSQLDNKLWSTLSCPVKGVEFDQKTLQFIDSDADGHIRVPEVLAAAEWAGKCLKDKTQLVSGTKGILISAISDETEDGRRILDAASTLLKSIDKPDNVCITVDDICDSEAILASARFNGDGVITPATTDDENLKNWITDIIACFGSETDRSGDAGITRDILERFSADVSAWLEWNNKKIEIVTDTLSEEAIELWHLVKPKIDDFFIRCQMANYDNRAVTILNCSDELLTTLAPKNLSGNSEEIAVLPLSSVTLQCSLSLEQGINPAWIEIISKIRSEIIIPLIGDRASLSDAEWGRLKTLITEYEIWWDKKVETAVIALGKERMNDWVRDKPEVALLELIDNDIALKPSFDSIVELERLTRYCRDLLPFVNNFVSFRDFYTGKGKAIFQSGTLFLDGRSFDLCITVTDVAKHALLANLSRVYLLYCDCVRNGGNNKMTIAVAITNGDSDQLLVGRNGIFYDRQGVDWDATVVRLIEHPISIKQAFWDPYKRMGKMVSEGIQKLAAAKSRANEDRAIAGIIAGSAQKTDTKPAQQAFDVGKFAGIFAAVGLAIGAIGTAIASILTGFLKLPWWQMPLVMVGVMLFISGPSILLAWFKLRQRNLGRLLDANGWAVNTRARINIPFGASLTGMAHLPEGVTTTLLDPFAEKQSHWRRWLLITVFVIALIVVWRMGYLSIK